MADDTFRTKGAIEPDGSFSSSSDNIFRWKGAIEPTGVAAVDLIKPLILHSFAVTRAANY